MTNRYPAYKPSGEDCLGDIPAHWEVLRLKYRASYRTSNVDKKTKEGELPVRLCNYTDVYYRDRIRAGDSSFMKATASPQELVRFRLNEGDVVITKDSEDWQDIAVPAFIEETADDFVCGYHLGIIRPTPLADPGFVFRAMQSVAVNCQLQVAATGITRFGLPKPAVSEALIPFPPHDEQQAIAQYLDTETARIDTLISKKRRLIELLQERWGVWVRNQLASLPNPALPLKRSWRVIDCKHRTPTYVEEGYPVVSPGDTTPGRLDLRRAHRFVDESDYNDLASGYRQPKRGDIVYSRNASIGIASYVDTDEPFCMGQDVCLIQSNDMDQLFLMYALNSIGLDQLETQKIGSTFDRVNISQILEIRVPVPDPSEQQKLGRRFDLAASRRSRAQGMLEQQINLLKEYRTTLITAAVTGQVSVERA